MKLELKKRAIKQLTKIPKKQQIKISRKLILLETKPRSVGKQLEGEYQGYYSLRAWPYRIIYSISKNVVTIHHIKHRQGAYK